MKLLYVNPALRPQARVRYFSLNAGFMGNALAQAVLETDRPLASEDAVRLLQEQKA